VLGASINSIGSHESEGSFKCVLGASISTIRSHASEGRGYGC
jgi:hypothetical protein